MGIITVDVTSLNGSLLYPSKNHIIHMDGESFVYAFSMTTPDVSFVGHAKFNGLDTASPTKIFDKMYMQDVSPCHKLAKLTANRFAFFYSVDTNTHLRCKIFEIDSLSNDINLVAQMDSSQIYVAYDTNVENSYVIPKDQNSFYWVTKHYSGGNYFIRVYDVSFVDGGPFTVSLKAESPQNLSGSNANFYLYDVDENGDIYMYERIGVTNVIKIFKFDTTTETFVTTYSSLPSDLKAVYVVDSSNFIGLPTNSSTTYYHYDGSIWHTKSITQTATIPYYEFFKINNQRFGFISSYSDLQYNLHIKLGSFSSGMLSIHPTTLNNDGLYFPITISPAYSYYLSRQTEGNRYLKTFKNETTFLYCIQRLKGNEISWIIKTIKGQG